MTRNPLAASKTAPFRSPATVARDECHKLRGLTGIGAGVRPLSAAVLRGGGRLKTRTPEAEAPGARTA